MLLTMTQCIGYLVVNSSLVLYYVVELLPEINPASVFPAQYGLSFNLLQRLMIRVENEFSFSQIFTPTYGSNFPLIAIGQFDLLVIWNIDP